MALTPFLDLVMVWNRGVSYGLFTQDGGIGRWVLVALGIGGATLFSWWLWMTRGMLATLALGLVIGGAVANVIDRLAYGAVADFFLFHIGRFEWYVFNLADVWIVAGAVGSGARLGPGTPRNRHGSVRRRVVTWLGRGGRAGCPAVL